MPVNAFLARLGFSADPFESTNASEEPGLPNYFVPPPYFTSILGNIDTPKSHVILAPRGGGKTAQRLMIEHDSVSSGKYLCVTYDEFDILTSTQVTWAAHMKQICRLLLVGILVKIDREPTNVHQLSDSEKRLLKQQVSSLLGTISAEEFARSIRALKNFADHARDYWNRYGGLVASLVNAFIAKYGFDKLDVPTQLSGPARLDDSLRFQFGQLLRIIQKVGFQSTYILVDRVDELSSTSKDAKSTFHFIYPLLTDLPTLETEGVAFK